MASRNVEYRSVITTLVIAGIFFNKIHAEFFAAADLKPDNRLLTGAADHPVGVRSFLFKKSPKKNSAITLDKATPSDSSTSTLVEPNPIVFRYHHGPILNGVNNTISLYVVYYGSFSSSQILLLRTFFGSFGSPDQLKSPTVAKWWEITKDFKNQQGASVGRFLRLAGDIHDYKYSHGKSLNASGIETILIHSLQHFPNDPEGIYLILTAHDVLVPGFCVDFCGEHFYTNRPKETNGKRLLYAWIGNAATQCPGYCCWPYAPPPFPMNGPLSTPLIAPNNDVGVDGMIISIADSISSVATDPFGTGYYEGDSGFPLEAAGACKGSFGPNAFPGYPGDLLIDHKTHASFNVYGALGREFLVPMLLSPSTQACAIQYS